MSYHFLKKVKQQSVSQINDVVDTAEEEKMDQTPLEESPSLEKDPTRKVSSPTNKGTGTARRAPNDPREVRRQLKEESK